MIDSVKLLKDIIRINSTQPEGNEADVAEKIEEYLPDCFELTRINNGDNRYTLIAKLPGKTDDGGVAMIGHMDTVSFGDMDAWNFDPLGAEEKDGMIYGRGSADMKGGVAAMTAAAVRISELECTPEKPLILCYTTDEENLGIGVASAIKDGFFENIDSFIVTEPTDLRLGLCEKGALWIKFSVKGVQSHGSRPEIGLNAAEACMKLCMGLRERFPEGAEHPLLGYNTITTTGLSSGVGTNVVPPTAEATMDIRLLPGYTNDSILEIAEELCREIEIEDARWSCSVEVINQRPAAETFKGAHTTELLTDILDSMGLPSDGKGLFFYTDAAQVFEARPTQFAIVGPGDDKQAHQTNEHIPVDHMNKAEEIYFRYLKDQLF